jgi:hypothetical protein
MDMERAPRAANNPPRFENAANTIPIRDNTKKKRKNTMSA